MTTSITPSMIEYESDTVTVVNVAGQRYRVELEEDPESTPFDADCYGEEDIEAWREDRWEFVSVVVTPLSVYECDQFELSDALCGVEFGSYVWNRGNEHEGAITLDRLITEHPVPDMVDEVARKVAAYWARQAEHLGGNPLAAVRG